jgi:chemotaxis protein methyltransferase CheR
MIQLSKREIPPMAQAWPEIADLSPSQFATISHFVKERCGINLHEGKMALVKARLYKRLHRLGLSSFGQYVDRIRNDVDGSETAVMLDAISTNVTHFFREPHHFNFLRESALPWIMERRRRDHRIRLWSAGCSSGEEPYSIAITLCEAIPDAPTWDTSILATDLSRQMLGLARNAVYESRQLQQIPNDLLNRYFSRCANAADASYRIAEPLKKMVHFARLNLIGHWPMKGPFDAIFCRNVMIYFDKPTQHELIKRFWDILAPGGVLFIGHSESLPGVQHHFQYLEPAVYRKT